MKPAQKRLLLVEDEKIIAMNETLSLEAEGYSVVSAPSGEEAVALLTSGELFDLILLDIDLGGGMDGTTAAEIILKNHDVPILFLSSHTDPEIVEKTERITNYGYVVKNSGNTVLFASIKMAFKLHDANCELSETVEKLKKTSSEFEKVNTELLHSQKNLAASEEKFSKAFQLSPDAININRLSDGLYIDINQGFVDAIGYTREELIGRSSLESDLNIWAHPQDRARLVKGLQADGEFRNLEAEFCRKDGSIIFGIMSARVFELDGEACILSITRDITEQASLAKKIMSIARFPAENPFPVLRIDKAGGLLYANDSAQVLLRVWNCSVGDAVPPDWQERVTHALSEKIRRTIEVPIGDEVYAFSITPIPDAGYVNLYGENITVLKKTGIMLQEKNTELTAANEQMESLIEELQASNEEFEAANEELARSENELLESQKIIQNQEERLRFALAGANEGLWDMHLPSGEMYLSPSSCEMLGCSPDEIKEAARIWRDFVHPDDLALTNERLFAHLDGALPSFEVEQRLRTKTGAWKWILTRGKITARDENGDPTRVTGTHLDISDRKAIEEEVRIKTNLLNLTGSMAKVGGWEFDPDTRQGTWTEQVAVIHDLDPNIKTDVDIGISFYIGSSREKIEAAIKDAIESGIPYDLELEMVTAKGIHKWVRTVGTPVLADGKVTHVHGIFQDITERKQAEHALHAANEQYRILVENIHDLVCEIDSSGTYIYVSHSYKKVLGYEPSELLGHNAVELLYPDDVQPASEIYTAMLFPGSVFSGTWRFKNKQGQWRWIECHSTTYQKQPGDMHVVIVSQDVTERKRIDDALLFLLRSGYAHSGDHFFELLVEYLAEALDMHDICIDQLMDDRSTFCTVARYLGGAFRENVTHVLSDTPAEQAIGKTVCSFTQNLRSLFPKDDMLHEIQAESYIGVTLWGSDGKPIGIISLFGRTPADDFRVAESILKLVAVRVAGELERRQTEKKLQQSRLQYQKMFEHHGAVFLFVDPDSLKIVDANIAAEKFYGYSRDTLKNMYIYEINQLSREQILEKMTLIRTNEREYFIFPHRLANGDIRTVEVYTSLVELNQKMILISIIHDVTERRYAEEELLKSLEQKEVLMKELQHRVKNNLNIISSLLGLEISKVNDDTVKRIIRDAQSRIRSMSGIYEQLYLSETLDQVDLKTYIAHLTESILETFTLDAGNISIATHLETVLLETKRAVPIGLILNELITNSLKYAYPRGEGQITVTLTTAGTRIVLCVEDGGIGLPDINDEAILDKMGFKIVRMLVQQLEADITFGNSTGTKICISLEKTSPCR